MFFKNRFKNELFDVGDFNFNDKALELFFYQAERIKVYKAYIESLKIDLSTVIHYQQIPFLPINFFKHHKIIDPEEKPQEVFLSSGTSGMVRSRHYVSDPEFYKKVSEYIFQANFGPLTDYNIIALLPSYQENSSSSLIYMINHFLSLTQGAFVSSTNDFEYFFKKSNQKINLLFGVTYALLDLTTELDISQSIIIETGGMKGRGKELSRDHVHRILTNQFGVKSVYAEYGMTELLSQAYSKINGIFQTPPWMKFLLREVNDPLATNQNLRSGGLNIIDLANIDSCAFIMTEDIASKAEGGFQILGRLDNSDTRGCNLLYTAD